MVKHKRKIPRSPVIKHKYRFSQHQIPLISLGDGWAKKEVKWAKKDAKSDVKLEKWDAEWAKSDSIWAKWDAECAKSEAKWAKWDVMRLT